MGSPILMAVEGEAAEIVAEAGCGVCIPSGDAGAMAHQLVQMSSQPERLAVFGRRGRVSAARFYNRRSKADAML